ncbi:fibrobacter succinogenes major paralogous domain-containing protein [Chryseobacterium sp. MA9]|uniref:fibrobacter succinogenes major paralogous domain-containing protein n=1 Tax=Chryseobacterium sp. MA9 TaxID=2966625 RepID=UPI0021069DD6|nr:fibrobacter succinogenes major paralogous domain-containing protein [Chryseobacterium sp. MA9]UTX48888.1 hypothetical protein KIK00_01050 [Chryseobacterium sp. MA9]
MKNKILFFSAGLFLATGAYGQVGINTPTPRATLDVTAKIIDGTAPEGIIAPRLTGDALFAAGSGTTPQYGNDQDGAIVYVTQAVSPGNDTGQTANIDAPGYYYFDASANRWEKVGNGSTIYKSDGTLTSARTMDMNNSTMGFVNGRMSVGVSSSHPSSVLELQSSTRGFLPPRMTRAQVDAIVNPAPGLVVYCTDFLGAGKGCLMVNDSVDPSVPQWGSMCSSNAASPIVLILDCASAVTSGTLYDGQNTSGVTTTVPYTGGNGGVYQAASFNSTGVSGLIASLPSGTLNNGNGSLVFNITGIPAGTGTASFTISIAGQSCSFNIPVTDLFASVGSLTCGSAVFSPAALSQGTAYSGTLTVPYVGGNGAAYPQSSFTQNGLTFTLPAGNLVNGNGNLVYNVNGTPATSGAMTVPVSFGGSACNVNTTVAVGSTVVMPGNPQAWMRHNLGADYSLDPDVPVQAIFGNYYQWGRPAAVATAYTPEGAIPGWNPNPAADNSWQDTVKTANDPCPAGFRVPTSQQLSNLWNNTTKSNVGTWTANSPSNFGAAKVLSSGNNKLTLPAGGYRWNSYSGTLQSRGGLGNYWSSSMYYQNSFYLQANEGSGGVVSNTRVRGYHLRCISQ